MKIQISADAFNLIKMNVKRMEKSVTLSRKRIISAKKKYPHTVARMQKVLAKREKKLKILKSSLKKLTTVKV